jgi:hypothetical protein
MDKLYLTKLNDEQLEIVNNNDFKNSVNYAMCIIACAGSGKTTTIISKIIYMIKNLNCDPEHFFITTFTRNAAGELKDRLAEYLTDKQIGQMTIGTFHSIAYKNVNNNKSEIETNIIEDNIEKYLYNYLELLKSSKYKKIHKYIFIDEYQDINEVQENIIKTLYSKAKLLVTVGDDQQNIYTFRKTNIKYILEFTTNYYNSHYFYLNRNYRSQKNIIELANIVLSYNKNKLDKELIAMSNEKIKKIKVMGFANQHDELKYFVDSIYIKYIDPNSNVKLHDIVIVSRNNSTLQKIESALAEKRIPTYYMETIEDNKITRENIQRIKNRVILSTIHGTKGLEFENVFMLDLKQGVFPSLMCIDIEEERRLFYVGITRAKKNLILCYTKNKPSQFITEITQKDNFTNILNLNIPVPHVENVNLLPFKDIKSVTNIINKLGHEDYEKIRKDIFDYKNIIYKIGYLHLEIPIHFSEYFEERNLLISNISNIFGDFMETFVSRCILQSKNKVIDHHDYIMLCLSEVKYYVNKLQDPFIREYIDNKYGTKLIEKTEEYIIKLKNYFDLGIEIKGNILKYQKSNFISAYKSYISNKQSSDIIFDLLVISLIKGITRGRSSLQHLINFSDNFISKKINKDDMKIYKNWLYSVQIGCIMFVKDIDPCNVFSQYTIRDDLTQIKGILDILIDDHIIEIKTYKDSRPHIEMLVQLLAYVGLARRKGLIINKVSIYNPIHGNLYTWDVSEWNYHNELIEFMSTFIND